MVKYTLRELTANEWMANSEYVQNLTENSDDIDEEIEFPSFFKNIPDYLTDENIVDVYSTVDYIGSEPLNFIEYMKSKTTCEFDELMYHLDMKDKKTNERFSKYVNFSQLNGKELYEWIAKNGHIDLLKYIFQYISDDLKIIFKMQRNSVINGHLDFLISLEDLIFLVNVKDLFHLAAENGKLNCLKYLHKKNCTWTEEVIKLMINNGNIECLEYAYKNGCILGGDSHCVIAVNSGHLEVVKFMQSIGIVFPYAVMHLDMNFEMIKYFHKSGYDLTSSLFDGNVIKGNLECIRYLYANGCDSHDDIIEIAASLNHTEIVKYLHQKSFKMTANVAIKAIRNGNTILLAYLLKNNWPLPDNIFDVAASNSLVSLTYLHKNGYTWGENTMNECVKSSSLDRVTYLHKNGCPFNEDTYLEAVKVGILEVMSYLRENGCPWDSRSLIESIVNINIFTLSYLIENKCPIDDSLRDNKRYMSILNSFKPVNIGYRLTGHRILVQS